jgi:HEAT repeat protein
LQPRLGYDGFSGLQRHRFAGWSIDRLLKDRLLVRRRQAVDALGQTTSLRAIFFM